MNFLMFVAVLIQVRFQVFMKKVPIFKGNFYDSLYKL
jgi:hypothetical protein